MKCVPKGSNQKFKLYRLAQIMQEQTDDEHYITMPEIMDELAKYNIAADRKSLYNDLRDLSVLGIDVEGEPIGNRYHYHVVNRAFELPELKLLVDAIQSSKFITEKKTNALIKKLETLVSKYDAQKLQRQVYVSGRIKTMNESIYYTVDAIHNAISENKKIKFQYYQWNVKKEMEMGLDVPSCGAALSNMAVTPSGDVVACQSCLDRETFGNILRTGWKQIWNHPVCKKYREYSRQMQQKCPLGKEVSDAEK